MITFKEIFEQLVEESTCINCGNIVDENLRKWLDDALATFDKVYSGQRPGFVEGYKALKEAIEPWGN